MRVAVVLPSLPEGSLVRRDLRAMLRALPAAGIEPEGFAEWPGAWRDADLEVFHYLRLPERHAAAPFATGLYPLGRDWQPFEAAFVSALRFPGLVWVVDPVLHHLVVGGIALRARWREYEELLEQAFPGRGEAILGTVASGWGTRASFRRFDPLPWLLREQAGLCAATAPIAAGLQRRGIAAPVVPLASAADRHGGQRGAVQRLLVLTFHYGAPRPTLEALRDLLASRPQLQVTAVVPEVVRDGAVMPLAVELGLHDRVRWIAPDDVALVAELARTDAVVHLRDDPVVGERALLQEAASAGLPLVLLRIDGAHGVPDGVAVPIEPGRAYAASLTAALGLLHDRDTLAAEYARRARDWAASRPTPASIAGDLAASLGAASVTGFRERPVSAGVWQRLQQRAGSLVTPRFAAEEVATLTSARLRACAPGGLLDGQGRRPGAPDGA